MDLLTNFFVFSRRGDEWIAIMTRWHRTIPYMAWQQEIASCSSKLAYILVISATLETERNKTGEISHIPVSIHRKISAPGPDNQ
jgi:hypothetical protein